jgi:hypothetical protein
MYKLCKNGGIIVCIMSTGWLWRSGRKESLFRNFIGLEEGFSNHVSVSDFIDNNSSDISLSKNRDEVHFEMIPSGEFKKSGTMVNSMFVILFKK